MPNVIITLEYGNHHKRDLAVPLDVPCRILSADLARALEVESVFEETFTLSERRDSQRRRLFPSATLGESQIYNGSTLELTSEQRPEARPQPKVNAALYADGAGKMLLNSAYTLIGRKDVKHGILPDLDLTGLDANRLVSRRHACIEFDQRNYLITDLASANGTWVNGQRLDAQRPTILKDGDEITFGRKGVRVRFTRG